MKKLMERPAVVRVTGPRLTWRERIEDAFDSVRFWLFRRWLSRGDEAEHTEW